MRRAVAALTLLALLIAACDVIGGSMDTVIEVDESGYVEISVGFAEDPASDPTDCAEDQGEWPPGTSVTTSRGSGAVWCNYQIPFGTLQELRNLYDTLFADALRIQCLAFQDERLIYHVELISDEAGEGDSYSIPIRLHLPGPIGSHNADEVDGNVLTWNLTPFVGTRPLKVNVPEDELCPTGFFEVFLLVNDDGTGTATLTIPFYAAGNGVEALAGTLRSAGWEVDGAEAASPGLLDVFQARRRWDSQESFAELAQAIPPLTRSDSSLQLQLFEDQGTGFLQFRFNGRLDVTRYATFWESYSGAMPPPLRFIYSPPGTVDTVAGSWTNTAQLELVWNAEGAGGPFPLQAVTVLAPELTQEVSDETATANLDALATDFLNEIPAGQVTTDPTLKQRALGVFFAPGTVNNMTNWTTFACGDYQTRVLRWLESIRTHPDPQVRAQLGGLDFGPIQAYNGGHQAVVLFRRGTDWRQTGTVLDPWPSQRPQVWTMEEWTARFTWGIGVGEGGVEYPHMGGGASGYRGTDMPPERLHPVRFGVNSPVDVLVTASDGRRVGHLPGGEFVNEIEHADFYPTERSGGEYQWYFGLPQAEYEVEFTGTGEGDVHILVAGQDGELVTYGPQPIESGQTAHLSFDGGSIDQPLTSPSGDSVEPIEVTDDNVGEIDWGDRLEGAADGSGVSSPARVGYLVGLALCLLLPAGGVWLFLVRRMGRST